MNKKFEEISFTLHSSFDSFCDKHDLNAILQNSSLQKETGQLNFSFKGFLRVSEHTKINWPLILVKSR